LSIDIHSSSRGKHAVLLYKSILERDKAALDYINKGLNENQLCIYASVEAYDQLHLSNISSKIVDFKENIYKRNLLIVNLKPFYDSALKGDLTPFENLKKQIQEELELRNNNKSVTIVADCADNLFQNQYFDQSQLVESWWHHAYIEWIRYDKNQGRQQQKQHHVTIVCPHLDLLLHKHPFDQHKYKILDNHSITIDMAGHTIMTSSTLNKLIVEPQPLRATESTSSQMKSQTHILIAEPNPELRSVYSMWLRSRGFKNILVTDSGSKCIEEFDRITNINQLPNLIVILDSHLRDISFIELAKQIINKRPDQILIFTTTLPSDIINSISINISSNIKTLLKPFKLSKLLQLIGKSS
jgi:CheY-like chemotaxis protein